MKWKHYNEFPDTKVAPDVLGACSTCCSMVISGSMWGTEEDEPGRGGWVVCDDCHTLYLTDPGLAMKVAQDRWDTDGPCKEEV